MTEIDVLRIRETKDGWPTPVEIVTVDTDSLAAAIGAEYVEVYHRKVGHGGRPYVVVCDEIGRISERFRFPTAVAVTADGTATAAFFGDILVCNDGDEDLASLTAKDIAYIKESIGVYNIGGRPSLLLEVGE